MSTEKLYYNDPYMKSFTAQVRSCTPAKDAYAVTLDRTAFYPEGGGQPCDLGVLGGAEVLAVHERCGEVEHLLAQPLEVGKTVCGEIDWTRRFDLMQQHSGEHIVSGMICGSFGCDNVGFHIGADCVTIDFNCEMNDAQLREIEQRANAYIWENHALEILWPTAEELAALEYRSKKELQGDVRIASFPGADICACCGTHVLHSAEVGMVKLLSRRKFREGVRIEMVCGGRALRRFDALEAQNGEISNLLSAKPLETAAAVRRLSEETAALQYRLTGLEMESFARIAAQLQGAGDLLLFQDGLSADGVRKLALAVMENCGGICAVFSGEGDSYKYALGRKDGEVRAAVQALNTALRGRGGGKNGFAQGSVQASREEIEAYFAAQGLMLK